MKSFILHVLLFLFLQGYLTATLSWKGTTKGGVSATITLSSNDLTLADTLSVDIELTYPKGYEPNIPEMRHHLLSSDGFHQPPFTFSKQVVAPPSSSSGENKEKIQQHITFLLSPELPGKYPLSLENITFFSKKSSNTKPLEIVSEIFEVNIREGASDFHPNMLISPLLPLSKQLPVSLSFSNKRMFIENGELTSRDAQRSLAFFQGRKLPWEILPIAFVILITFILIKIPQKTSKPVNEPLPLSSLKKQTFEKLEKLSKKLLESDPHFDLYITEVDQVVRSFIEQRLGINAPALTTQEFLKKTAESSPIDPHTRTTLLEFLQTTDKVKFAEYTPSTQECLNLVQTAKKFVNLEYP